MNSKGEIILYQTKDKKVQLEVKLKQETIWLTQQQIAKLFGTQRPAITKHLSNIFKNKELQEDSVCSILEHTARDGKVYSTKYYSLDAIVSIGYRVNSARATQFRIWATNVLKKYLIDGYALNEQRLQDQRRKLEALQKAIKLIQNVKGRKELEYKEAMGLLEVISDYSYALELLDDYDAGQLKISGTSKEEKFRLTYEEALKAVRQLKKKFGSTGLFAQEKDKSFKSSISSIYQTFERHPFSCGSWKKIAFSTMKTGPSVYRTMPSWPLP